MQPRSITSSCCHGGTLTGEDLTGTSHPYAEAEAAAQPRSRRLGLLGLFRMGGWATVPLNSVNPPPPHLVASLLRRPRDGGLSKAILGDLPGVGVCPPACPESVPHRNAAPARVACLAVPEPCLADQPTAYIAPYSAGRWIYAT
eukprot:364846-Chlamydomonas_euryale.AAC.5